MFNLQTLKIIIFIYAAFRLNSRMERFFSGVFKSGGSIAAMIELGRPWNGIIVALLTVIGSMMALQAIPVASFILIGGVLTLIIYMAATILNDIYDVEPDKINMPYRPLERNAIKRSTALNACIFLYGLSVIISILVSFNYFIAILLMSVISLFYSLPPFSAKDKGIWGNIVLSVSMIFTSMYAGFVLVTNSLIPSYEFLITISLFTLSFCLISVLKDFKDIYGDKLNRKFTFVVRYDKNISIVVSIIGTILLLCTVYLMNLYFIKMMSFIYISFIIILFLFILEIMTYKKFSIELGEKTWAYTRIIVMFLAVSIFTFSFIQFY